MKNIFLTTLLLEKLSLKFSVFFIISLSFLSKQFYFVVDLRSAFKVYKHFYLQDRRKNLTVNRTRFESPVVIRKAPRNKENIPSSCSIPSEVIDLASDESPVRAKTFDVINLVSDSDDSLSPAKVLS